MPDKREKQLVALFRQLPDRDKTELVKIAQQWVMMFIRKTQNQMKAAD